MDLGNGLELLREWFYKEFEDTQGGNQNQLIKLNIFFFYFFLHADPKSGRIINELMVAAFW
jgi:hypothetical protein